MKPVQFFWYGQQLSTHALISLNSFCAQGHKCILYTHGDIKNVPMHVELADASTVLPMDDDLVCRSGFGSGSVAPYADLFRFVLLSKYGGIWSDLDVVCLRPWVDLPKRFIASSLEVPEGDLPNINAISLETNDTFAETWITLFRQFRDPCDYAFGVAAASIAFKLCLNKPTLLPSAFFNPISYRNARYLIMNPESVFSIRGIKRILRAVEPLNIPIPDKSYGLHLWSQMWSSNGWAQDQRYPTSTLYGKLQERYL